MNSPDEDKRPNSIRLLIDMLATAVGIRSSQKRDRDFTKIGTGTLLGALAVLVAVLIAGMYTFVHLVQTLAAR
jgi:hypothetical protein